MCHSGLDPESSLSFFFPFVFFVTFVVKSFRLFYSHFLIDITSHLPYPNHSRGHL